MKLERAVEEVKKLLVPVSIGFPDGFLDTLVNKCEMNGNLASGR